MRHKTLNLWSVFSWPFSFNEETFFRSSRLQLFSKIDIVKNFTNFIGKLLCWSLFLIKLQIQRPEALLKRDSNTGVFLWNLRTFCEIYFWKNCVQKKRRGVNFNNCWDILEFLKWSADKKNFWNKQFIAANSFYQLFSIPLKKFLFFWDFLRNLAGRHFATAFFSKNKWTDFVKSNYLVVFFWKRIITYM